MNKFISNTALLAVSILLGVGVGIYGWGLEPQSWWWIIGAGIGGKFLLAALEYVNKESKN